MTSASLDDSTDLPTAWPHGVPRDVEIPDEPLTALLERAVREHPDHVAVDFLGKATTYRELAAQVDRGARVLADLGVQPGDRVALVLPNCTSHLVAFWSVLRLGAVVVEHNPTYTAEELAHQLADSGATVAVVWEQAVPRVLEARDRTELRHVVAVDLSADLPHFIGCMPGKSWWSPGWANFQRSVFRFAMLNASSPSN